MTRWGIIAAWLVVAAIATAATWAVLSSADRQTRPAPAVIAVPSSSTSTTRDTAPTNIPLSTTSTTVPATSSTTTTTSPSTTTTTEATSPSTPTTTEATSRPPVEAAWTSLTVPSGGGVVVVSHRPREVRFESATPNPGYVMEIDQQGPDEVRVEFEGEDDDFEVRVRWTDGALAVEVS